MTTPQAMTDLQLAFVVLGLPGREELLTGFERAARDEYDRRVLERESRAA